MPHPTLTERQLQVLYHLANGKTDSEIAQTLGIKRRTVRFHVSNIKARLGVHSRLQVIHIAHLIGILPLYERVE